MLIIRLVYVFINAQMTMVFVELSEIIQPILVFKDVPMVLMEILKQ